MLSVEMGVGRGAGIPREPRVPRNLRSLLGDRLCNQFFGRWEIVLCVACFAHTLLLLLLIIIILSFLPLLSYWTVFISTHEFYFLSILLLIPLGRGGVSERLCLVLAAGCWVKPRHHPFIWCWLMSWDVVKNYKKPNASMLLFSYWLHCFFKC